MDKNTEKKQDQIKRKKMKSGNRMITKMLPKPLHWTLHNMIAHPLSEIFYLSGYLCVQRFDRGDRLIKIGNLIHDVTIPYHKPGTGRG